MLPVPGTSSADAAGELLRSIVHELRQPLGAIESIAYYLGLILPHEDEKIRDQLARLRDLVDQCNWILASGLQLADPTPAAPVTLDVEELITQAVSSRPPLADTPPVLNLAESPTLVRLDPGRGRALVENLLALFQHLADEAHPVRLQTSPSADGGVSLELATSAPGYRSESTLGAGARLSLASARKLVAEQGGSLECSVDPESGIRLRVMLR